MVSNALLISPYHAESHKIWAEAVIAMCPEFNWRLTSLPPRFFDWRIRGNALALLFEPRFSDAFKNLDLIVATSMTDLSSLKGLCPDIQQVPCVIYFHENQFAYPPNQAGPLKRSLEAKMVTLYGALAADLVLFNSEFNFSTFIGGAKEMLKNFPDHAPLNCIKEIEDKSRVLAVPIAGIDGIAQANSGHEANIGASEPLKIAWNHRWEYDKGPDRLVAVIEQVAARNLNCEFSIFGQRFRQVPKCFEGLPSRYPKLINHFGYVDDKQEYYLMLQEHHVVLSTSLHDFQGLSVLEATHLGCVPLVPDRLAYREYLPAWCRYPSNLADIRTETMVIVSRLENLASELRRGALPQPPSLDALAMSVLAPKYRTTLHALLANRKGG